MNARLDNNCLLCTSLFARHRDVKINQLVLCPGQQHRMCKNLQVLNCHTYISNTCWLNINDLLSSPRDAEFHNSCRTCSRGLCVHLPCLLFYTDKRNSLCLNEWLLITFHEAQNCICPTIQKGLYPHRMPTGGNEVWSVRFRFYFTVI